jgi:hypothetical protein
MNLLANKHLDDAKSLIKTSRITNHSLFDLHDAMELIISAVQALNEKPICHKCLGLGVILDIPSMMKEATRIRKSHEPSNTIRVEVQAFCECENGKQFSKTLSKKLASATF